MAFKMKKPSMTEGTAAHKSALKQATPDYSLKSETLDRTKAAQETDSAMKHRTHAGVYPNKEQKDAHMARFRDGHVSHSSKNLRKKAVEEKKEEKTEQEKQDEAIIARFGKLGTTVDDDAPTKKRDKVARLEEKKARSQARTEIKKAKVKRKRTKQEYGKGTDFIASKQKVKDLKVDEKIRRAKAKTKPKPGVTEGATAAMPAAAISKAQKKPSPVKKEGLKALYPNPPKKGAKDLLMPRAKTVTLVHKSKRSAAGKEFDKAFAAARKAGKKTFTWKGKSYNTKLA